MKIQRQIDLALAAGVSSAELKAQLVNRLESWLKQHAQTLTTPFGRRIVRKLRHILVLAHHANPEACLQSFSAALNDLAAVDLLLGQLNRATVDLQPNHRPCETCSGTGQHPWGCPACAGYGAFQNLPPPVAASTYQPPVTDHDPHRNKPILRIPIPWA